MSSFKKVFFILSPQQKIKFFIITILILFLTVLELIGLGLIFPIVTIMTDPLKFQNFISDYSFLHFLYEFNQKEILIYLMIFVGIFYFFKALASIYVNFLKSKMNYSLIASISGSMFEGYIGQQLSFLIPKNSAYITRNIIDYPSLFVNNVLISFFTLLFELIFITGTFFIFISVNKPIGITTSILSISFILIFYVVNKTQIGSMGKSINNRLAERIKVTREAIEGIRDIRLFNKNEFFNKIFNEHNYKIVRLTALLEIKVMMPKFMLEFIAVLFIISSISFLLINGYIIKEIIPIISIIAAGLTKIVPSISRILSSLTRIQASKYIVNDMHSEIEKFRKVILNKNIIFELNDKISLNNISFSYSTSKQTLKNINFNIKKNTIFGIKGKSGSGKTTCLNLLSGFLNPKEGSILVDNIDIKENVSNWQSLISYLPQKIFITDDTLKRNICFGVDNEDIDIDKLNKVIKISKVNEFIGESDNRLDEIVGERGSSLSAGQIQRIGLARALYKNPKILILDESTSALDSETEKKILNDILKLKKDMTIIVVSHRDEPLSICDEVYNLNN
jgi:ABC-type multidrug transport system fused ATPase/permease subunit